jgi:CheY-like chemotaxis protein
MRDGSELSIFGRRPRKGDEHKEPEAAKPANPTNPDPLVPASSLPSATETLSTLFPAENATEPQPSAQEDTTLRPMLSASEVLNVEQLTTEELEALFPSENRDGPTASVTDPAPSAQEAHAAVAHTPRPERRAKRRALISAPVRVRSIDSTRNALDDITTTLNVSRLGILLTSDSPVYYRSMDVMVTFPHSKAPDAIQAEQPGRVVRVSELPDGRRSIAIALGVVHAGEEFILANGETVQANPEAPRIKVERNPNSPKPLVVALDAEANIRASLKSYLANEGYDVITVTNAREAREVLDQCTPALLIAEIEGDGMPGYDICAHCKSTPRLQSIPVMLTTSSAYPSDYASAHSLGAVVCMAKPYRQERLGHVVKLLAPPPNASENCDPPRPADPSRRHLSQSQNSQPAASNPNRRFRFGRKS